MAEVDQKPVETVEMIGEPSPKIAKNHAGADVCSTPAKLTSLLRVKNISETAVVPSRGSELSAGYDLSSAEDVKIPARGKALVPTGLSIAIPEGTYARIGSGSGSSCGSQIKPTTPPAIINNTIVGRGIITGRSLMYPINENNLVKTQLATLGWGNYPNCVSTTFNDAAVMDFYKYAQITYENGNPLEPQLTTFVFGRYIFLNKILLARILGVQNAGDCVFLLSGKKPLRLAIGNNDLGILRATIAKNEFCVSGEPEMDESALMAHLTNVNCFLVANVVPSVGTNGRVSQMRQFILYRIVTNRLLNLPFIFIKHVERTVRSDTMKLGYASIITYILQNGFALNLPLVRHCQSSLDATNLIRRRNHPYVQEEVQPDQDLPQQQQDTRGDL